MNVPKTKSAWKKVVAKYRLGQWKDSEGRGWLTYLPITNGKIKPVPFVMIKDSRVEKLKVRLAKERLTLQWSTMHLIKGYHHPKGYTVFALTRPPDSWWTAREEANDERRAQERTREAARVAGPVDGGLYQPHEETAQQLDAHGADAVVAPADAGSSAPAGHEAR